MNPTTIHSTLFSPVAISVSSGDKPATFEVPVLYGAEAAVTLCIEQIEHRICLLDYAHHTTKVGDINAQFNEIIGAIRMISVMTGLLPCDDDQVVNYLRRAAFRSKANALSNPRRK